MVEAKLVRNRFCIGFENTGGEAVQWSERHARVEAVGELIVGVIAEGGGSEELGTEAAQHMLDVVFTDLIHCTEPGIPQQIAEAVHSAYAAVVQENEKPQGGGLTTLSLVVICKDCLYVGNVGASRVYLVSETGKMAQLNQDHYGYPFTYGDTVLLCSDGLIEKSPEGRKYSKEQEIIEIAQSEAAPYAAAKIMDYMQTRQANENVSVAVIQNLTPGRFALMEQNHKIAARRSMVRRTAFFTGMGILAMAWLLAMSALFGSTRDDAQASNAPAMVRYILNTPQPTPMPTEAFDLAMAVSGQKILPDPLPSPTNFPTPNPTSIPLPTSTFVPTLMIAQVSSPNLQNGDPSAASPNDPGTAANPPSFQPVVKPVIPTPTMIPPTTVPTTVPTQVQPMPQPTLGPPRGWPWPPKPPKPHPPHCKPAKKPWCP